MNKRFFENLPTSSLTQIPLSLYIHFPWCIRKCPYCDFNSHRLTTQLPEENYIDALLADLSQDLAWLAQEGYNTKQSLHSIFMGGGTPSLFSGKSLARLLQQIEKRLSFSANIEITLEANPGTTEQARFHQYRQAGINRLSLGIQSLNDNMLKALGRIHQSDDAKRAVEQAVNAGFKKINIDMMYGLPQQNLKACMDDLSQAIALGTTHLSWYQLTLEPSTFFYKKPPPLPKHDLIWVMQREGQKLLTTAGFEQYEISAYARKQQYSQHNLNYWLFGDYLGIGAGAHGKITLPQQKRIIRTEKHKQPKNYLKVTTLNPADLVSNPDDNFLNLTNTFSFLNNKVDVPAQELLFEFMLNALRLMQPISLQLLNNRSLLHRERHADLIKKLQQASEAGLLILDEDTIQTTALGQRFLNDLMMIFLGSE